MIDKGQGKPYYEAGRTAAGRVVNYFNPGDAALNGWEFNQLTKPDFLSGDTWRYSNTMYDCYREAELSHPFHSERDKGHLIFQMFDEAYPGAHLKELSGEEHAKEWGKADDVERDWWIEITAPGGGFIPVPDGDVYMNEAPESGYQPMIRFEGRGSARTARGGPIRYYYFMTNGGAEYGVVSIEIRPVSYIRNDQFVRFRYKFNPSGSRNLATRNFKP